MAAKTPCVLLFAAGGKNRRKNVHRRLVYSPRRWREEPARKRALSFGSCALLAAGGKTGAKTCTIFCLECPPRRWRENRRKGQSRQASRQTHRSYGKKTDWVIERRRVREKGTGLVRKKRRSKEPRRYQPGLSSVLFVHGSSPGVQYSHSGEPLNNSIFNDTAINGSFFFEANYVHCMGISCFRSFLLRNRCRND